MHDVAHAPDHLAHARVAREVDPQRDRVHEHPERARHAGVAAVGDARCRPACRRGRRSGRAGPRRPPGRPGRASRPPPRPAPRRRAPSPARGGAARRRRRTTRAPRAGGRTAAAAAPEPGRAPRPSARAGRRAPPRWRPPSRDVADCSAGGGGGRAAVERAELAHEHVERPAVVREVVLEAEQRPALLGEPHQRPAQPRRLGRGRCAPARVSAPRAPPRPSPRRAGRAPRAASAPARARAGRLAVAHHDRGAQRLVAVDQRLQRRPQRRGVERAVDPHQPGVLVGARPRVHLAEQPAAPLGGGQRGERGARAGRDGGQRGAARVRRAPRPARAGCGARTRRRRRARRAPSARRRPTSAIASSESPPSAKKSSSGPGELAAEQLAPSRRRPAAPPRSAARRRLAAAAPPGLGQRVAVDLAALGQRHRVERDHGPRHVRARQPLGDVGAQRLGVERGARAPATRTRPAAGARRPRERTVTAARATSGCAASACSTSPGSTRTPPILTWRSRRPRKCSTPSLVLPHPVAGAIPAVDEALGGRLRVVAVAARDRRRRRSAARPSSATRAV